MRGSHTPAERLIESLGLKSRTTAEVQDLYSRPIAATLVLLARSRDGIRRSDRAAA